MIFGKTPCGTPGRTLRNAAPFGAWGAFAFSVAAAVVASAAAAVIVAAAAVVAAAVEAASADEDDYDDDPPDVVIEAHDANLLFCDAPHTMPAPRFW